MNPNQFESFVGGDQIKANQLVHKRIKNANVRRTKKRRKKRKGGGEKVAFCFMILTCRKLTK